MKEVAIVTGALLIGLVVFELVARYTKIPKNVMRKLIHVGMCVLVVGFSFFFDYHVMGWVGLFFTLLFVIARKVYKFQSIRDRHGESWGEIFFPLGIAASAFLAADHTAFVVALSILAFSDTAAFIVGKACKKSPVIIPGRTIAGSGAGLIVTVIILVLARYDLATILMTSAAVLIAEIFSKKGFDNFALPTAAVLVLRLVV